MSFWITGGDDVEFTLLLNKRNQIGRMFKIARRAVAGGQVAAQRQNVFHTYVFQLVQLFANVLFCKPNARQVRCAFHAVSHNRGGDTERFVVVVAAPARAVGNADKVGRKLPQFAEGLVNRAYRRRRLGREYLIRKHRFAFE